MGGENHRSGDDFLQVPAEPGSTFLVDGVCQACNLSASCELPDGFAIEFDQSSGGSAWISAFVHVSQLLLIQSIFSDFGTCVRSWCGSGEAGWSGECARCRRVAVVSWAGTCTVVASMLHLACCFVACRVVEHLLLPLICCSQNHATL